MDFNGISTFTLESSVRKQALKVLEESAELFAAVDAYVESSGVLKF